MPLDLNTTLRLAYLQAAQAAQQEVEDKIIKYRDFYEGEQGVELTDRQELYITTEPESLANFCKRTVAIPKDRLELIPDGITPANEGSQAYADLVTLWWRENQLDSKQKDVYEASLRDGNCGIIVGWDEQKAIPTFTPNLVYDGQTGLVRFHYDQDDKLLFASKRWIIWNPLDTGQTGKRRLTVYRPGQIERYEASASLATGWRFLNPMELDNLPNPQPWEMNGLPLGIPVVPFENPGGSELADVLTIQELVNHNLGVMDRVIDYHGFPILWFTNLDLPVNSSTGRKELPDFSPGTALSMSEGGQGGRIEAADLARLFQSGVMSWLQILAFIKGWPVYLLDRTAQPPSGLALQIMEGSLVKQIEDKQAVFGSAWKQAFDMGRKLHEIWTGQKIEGNVNLAWRDPKINDELSRIEMLTKKFEAGSIPIQQRWVELGYTQSQIDQMIKYATEQDQFGIVSGDVVTGVTQ